MLHKGVVLIFACYLLGVKYKPQRFHYSKKAEFQGGELT